MISLLALSVSTQLLVPFSPYPTTMAPRRPCSGSRRRHRPPRSRSLGPAGVRAARLRSRPRACSPTPLPPWPSASAASFALVPRACHVQLTASDNDSTSDVPPPLAHAGRRCGPQPRPPPSRPSCTTARGHLSCGKNGREE